MKSIIFITTALLSLAESTTGFVTCPNIPIKSSTPRRTSVQCTQLYAAAKATTKASKTKVKKAKASKAKAADVPTMRKGDMVAALADKTGMTKVDSEAALSAVLETIQEGICEGNKISLPGFGTFKTTHRAARMGRNPRTGEEIAIKASSSPSFTAAKGFKEKLNE